MLCCTLGLLLGSALVIARAVDHASSQIQTGLERRWYPIAPKVMIFSYVPHIHWLLAPALHFSCWPRLLHFKRRPTLTEIGCLTSKMSGRRPSSSTKISLCPAYPPYTLMSLVMMPGASAISQLERPRSMLRALYR